MTKKEAFMEIIKKEIFDRADIYAENYPDLFEDAKTYFEALESDKKETKLFTENGKLILQYIKDNKDSYHNLFKAKEIAEGLGLTSRTVSGSCRKLVNDGFIEKMGENPITYSLTTSGEEIIIPAE